MAISTDLRPHGSPDLDCWLGKVVEAEILHRYNVPVSFDPSLFSREFFLVLSVGRCRFCLTEHSAALIL